MAIQTTFAEILEAAEQLPLEDQESLIHILQNRLRDQKRTELVRGVQEAQQEFAQGQCQPLTPEQIMEEILSLILFYYARIYLLEMLEKL
ncbi:MAG: hypothetical protein GPJ18_08165 [Microcystis aeruginosa F13-15]|jgi:hypothetical protein|nr:hypothetical protein [Microcystis aeruginosa F13-15]